MKAKIITILLIVTIIFLGGVLTLNQYLKREISKTKPPERVGDAPTYINPKTCPEKAKLIIDQHNLSLIHSCDVGEIQYEKQTAYLVKISYGQGMDCPSGCIYAYDFSIVFDDNTIYQIKDYYFANPETKITDFIWEKIKLPISDVNEIATKELIKDKDKFLLKFTFLKYIKGKIYVMENQSIQGNIFPTEITIDQAREIALNELKKRGYQPNQSFKDPVSDQRFVDKDCWNFFVATEPKKHAEFDKCHVMVCLDGKTDVNCQP